ncbi:MAG: EVE domain-containing protein [Candidatus Methylacidiphilales bacterium]
MMRSPGYWLVKQEPEKYSWEQFLIDGSTIWDGVRNYQARNHLRSMKCGDRVMFYRSVVDPAVVGLCRVVKMAYADPTASEGDWSAVDLKAIKALKNPVTLAVIKSTPGLNNMALIRQSRLSVMPLSREEYERIILLSKKPSS